MHVYKHVYVHVYVHAGAGRGQRGVLRSPGAGAGITIMWVLGTESGPLEEWPMPVAAEPSLQLHHSDF